ncbi:hypothetical protein [Streptomyces sp. H27-H5]|uniref:hypothetical protein n=1 Tax=Streptomyces sp. H27-H5 TaxID=2996460 RepID=UPI002270A0F0|nr:hypothetical protein [Streptomyces sp. H27-H5]MCY0959979.1 hypothetical protein [Streptomyces sp. H27-H5]
MSALHVVPIGDLVEHVSEDDCLCEPTAKPVKADDGSIDWLMIHHSLDGRELTGNDHSG